MRVRAWVALGAAAASILFGLIGQATQSDAVYLLSGLAFLTAVFVGISLLPVWSRLGLRLPSMPGLFPRVGAGQHWDANSGTVQAGAQKRTSRSK